MCDGTNFDAMVDRLTDLTEGRERICDVLERHDLEVECQLEQERTVGPSYEPEEEWMVRCLWDEID